MNVFAKRKILVGQVLIQAAVTLIRNAAQTHKEEMVIVIMIYRAFLNVVKMDRFVSLIRVKHVAEQGVVSKGKLV